MRVTVELADAGTRANLALKIPGKKLSKAIITTMTTFMSTFHMMGLVSVTICLLEVDVIISDLELLKILDFLGILFSPIFA